MKILRWLTTAFSIYSRVPMPRMDMDKDDVAHSLLFFPLVGVIIGGVVVFINAFPPIAAVPVLVRVLLTAAIPLIITGGFHTDGFMDTEDALHSYAPTEKKLAILKDPHIGSFAVISFVKWQLLYLAAIAAVLSREQTDLNVLLLLGLTFVISRALTGLTSILFKKAKKGGMLHEETGGRQKGVLICLSFQVLFCCALILYLHVCFGALMIVTFAALTLYYHHKAGREFGGVTGDTAGYFLTMSEIFSALALAAGVLVAG